jgi:hypothetical protein
MARFRSWLVTPGVNVSPQRFSLRSGSMVLLPFIGFRNRFQSLTTGERDERLGELVRSAHSAQERFVVLSSASDAYISSNRSCARMNWQR